MTAGSRSRLQDFAQAPCFGVGVDGAASGASCDPLAERSDRETMLRMEPHPACAKLITPAQFNGVPTREQACNAGGEAQNGRGGFPGSRQCYPGKTGCGRPAKAAYELLRIGLTSPYM